MSAIDPDLPLALEPAGSGLGRPGDLHLPMFQDAVSKIEIDEALLGNPGVDSHTLEVGDDVVGQTHRDGPLELRRIWVRAGLQLGQIVFGFHDVSPP